MVSQTSIDAYHELVNSGHKFAQREKIFHFIRLNGPHTRRQISKHTGLELGAVSGRVNKLVSDRIFEIVEFILYLEKILNRLNTIINIR